MSKYTSWNQLNTFASGREQCRHLLQPLPQHTWNVIADRHPGIVQARGHRRHGVRHVQLERQIIRCGDDVAERIPQETALCRRFGTGQQIRQRLAATVGRRTDGQSQRNGDQANQWQQQCVWARQAWCHREWCWWWCWSLCAIDTGDLNWVGCANAENRCKDVWTTPSHCVGASSWMSNTAGVYATPITH